MKVRSTGRGPDMRAVVVIVLLAAGAVTMAAVIGYAWREDDRAEKRCAARGEKYLYRLLGKTLCERADGVVVHR